MFHVLQQIQSFWGRLYTRPSHQELWENRNHAPQSVQSPAEPPYTRTLYMLFDEDGILNPRFPPRTLLQEKKFWKLSMSVKKRNYTQGSSLPWGVPRYWREQELSQPKSRKAIVPQAMKDGLHYTVSPPPSEPKFSWDFLDLTLSCFGLGLCLADSNIKLYYNGLNK